MGEPFDHLIPAARSMAGRPAAERIARLWVDRWIGYTRAQDALERLEALLTFGLGRVRPPNLLITGPTNNGKTMIAEKFRRSHPPRISPDRHREIIPVLLVQTPSEPSVRRFYAAVLAALKAPVSPYGSAQRLESMVVHLLREIGTRLLIIDELHNMLAGSATRQREFLNMIRGLGNELRLPIAALGTKEAYLALRADDQLENRFEPFVLPLWEDGIELVRLLASFEAALPLREPSHLAGHPETRALILRRTEGMIGEIAALLLQATLTALTTGRERLDARVLEAAAYRGPSERRAAFEAQLRHG